MREYLAILLVAVEQEVDIANDGKQLRIVIKMRAIVVSQSRLHGKRKAVLSGGMGPEKSYAPLEAWLVTKSFRQITRNRSQLRAKHVQSALATRQRAQRALRCFVFVERALSTQVAPDQSVICNAAFKLLAVGDCHLFA